MNTKIIPLLLALALGVAPGSASQPNPKYIDFSNFSKGDRLSDLGDGASVVAWKRNGSYTGPLVPATAMIFDTANPSGQDPDLGTPNKDFGGPGIGIAGKEGEPTENRFFQGNVVIISEDDDSSDPDDHAYGGSLLFTFDAPVDLQEVGLLDNEEGTIFTALLASGATVQKIAGQGGDNSYEAIEFGGSSPVGALDNVVQLNITMGGSGAITHLFMVESVGPPTPLPSTPAPTPAPTPCTGNIIPGVSGENNGQCGGDPVSENR